MNIINRVHQGNALDVLKTFPDDFVNLVITSPPYWGGLRDYQTPDIVFDGKKSCKHQFNKKGYCNNCNAWSGQLGLEPSPFDYIRHLCDVFDECYRVLRRDGVLFVNIGDCYSSTRWSSSKSKSFNPDCANIVLEKAHAGIIGEKSLTGIPAMFQIEMTWNRGWKCRNDIIWTKPAPMTSSDSTKCTPDHEYLFFFVKNTANPLYYTNKLNKWLIKIKSNKDKPLSVKNGFEGIDYRYIDCPACTGINVKSEIKQLSIRDFLNINFVKTDQQIEKIEKSCEKCNGTGRIIQHAWQSHDYYYNQIFSEIKHPVRKSTSYGGMKKSRGNPARAYGKNTYSGRKSYDASRLYGKNRRSTWIINTANSPFKHYATFPRELIRDPIDSCCPREICIECDSPRFKIIRSNSTGISWHDHSRDQVTGQSKSRSCPVDFTRFNIGYSDCACNAGYKTGITLDPFMGSGTTAIETRSQGKNFIGIELNSKYIEYSKQWMNEEFNDDYKKLEINN